MTDLEITKIAFIETTINVGLAAVFGYLLFKAINRPDSSTQRRWLAWMVGVLTLTTFPRVLRQFDSNALAQWIINITVGGGLAWVAGWFYGKIKREKE